MVNHNLHFSCPWRDKQNGHSIFILFILICVRHYKYAANNMLPIKGYTPHNVWNNLNIAKIIDFFSLQLTLSNKAGWGVRHLTLIMENNWGRWPFLDPAKIVLQSKRVVLQDWHPKATHPLMLWYYLDKHQQWLKQLHGIYQQSHQHK